MISQIQYNILNLPSQINFADGSVILNIYAADGRKLSSYYASQVTQSVSPQPIKAKITDLTPVAISPTQLNTTDIVEAEGTHYIDNFEYLFDIKSQKEKITSTRIHNSEGYVSGSNFFYFRRDHLGNNREVWNANTQQTVQVTNYYPSGLPWKYETAQIQPYTYNDKEFVEMFGYDSYDYGFRGYYPAIGRFTTIDPLAHKYYSWSPYVYCMGNPIRFIDPTGMATTIYVTGANADDYTNQLNAASSLTITRNAETGKLSATGEAKTADDKKLLEAINSTDVVSTITADNSMKEVNGGVMIGGAFGGNTLENETTTINRRFEDAVGEIKLEITQTVAKAKQYVNPEVLGNLDKANGNNGQAALHEALESYTGGLISLKNGTSSPASNVAGSVYTEAHKKAPYQGGTVTEKVYDNKGNIIPASAGYAGAVKAEYYSNGKLIMTYP